MNKIDGVIFVILFVISCVYSYVQPDEKIENIKTNPQITIYIEGKIEKTLVYDYQPNIKEIFEDIHLDNIYGFDNNYTLSSKQQLYIPLSNDLISLNHANQEQLMTIKGIGEKTALKIIEYRNKESFKTIEDITQVSGIGYKTYLKIREYLCL